MYWNKSPALQRYGLLNDMYCLAKLLQQRIYKYVFLKSCLEEITDKFEVFYYDSKEAKLPYKAWYTLKSIFPFAPLVPLLKYVCNFSWKF